MTRLKSAISSVCKMKDLEEFTHIVGLKVETRQEQKEVGD